MIENTLPVPTQRTQVSRTMLIQIQTCSQQNPDAAFDPQITVVRADQILEDGKPFGVKTHTIGRLGSKVVAETVDLADGTKLTFPQIAEAIKRMCDRWDTEGGNQITEAQRGPRGRQ